MLTNRSHLHKQQHWGLAIQNLSLL
jgi:hypothetical protein